MKDTAIILLSCMDFESLEIALANYMETTNPDVHMFILQNGRGTYDKERTYRVACRYRDLYPDRITVIDWIPEQKPYSAIRYLINSKELETFKYICKVDDDTFPVTADWIEKLKLSYIEHKNKYQEKLAFTFPLVNNNPFGFKRTIELMGLEKEYYSDVARRHLAGAEFGGGELYPLKILEKNEYYPSGFGTCWRYAYMARWIHSKTTLDVENWIQKIKTCKDEIFDNKIRYSINCMFFEKEYWNSLDNGTNDDETSVHLTAMKENQKNICVLSVPFVHLFFFIQRDENRTLISDIRQYYQNRLKINYPITICESKQYELENRLRFLETKLNELNINNKNDSTSFIQQIFSVVNNNQHKIITILGIKFKIRKNIKR